MRNDILVPKISLSLPTLSIYNQTAHEPMSEPTNTKGQNADMMSTIYRLAVVILLAGILVMQWQILSTMNDNASNAVTLGALQSTGDDPEARQALMDQMPLVRIQGGNVGVRGSVTIERPNPAARRGNQNQTPNQ